MCIVILEPWLISSSTGQSFSTECRMTSETESMQQTRNAGAATQLNTYRLCYHQQPSHMPAHMLTSLCTSQNLSVPAAAPALLCILLAETVSHPLHATVWYDQQPLVVTEAAQHFDPVPIQAHCAALKQLHLQEALDLLAFG